MTTISPLILDLFQRLIDNLTHLVDRLYTIFSFFKISFAINRYLKGLILFFRNGLLCVRWLDWLLVCLLQPKFLEFGPVITKMLDFTEFFSIKEIFVFEGHLVALLSHLHRIEQSQR